MKEEQEVANIHYNLEQDARRLTSKIMFSCPICGGEFVGKQYHHILGNEHGGCDHRTN